MCVANSCCSNTSISTSVCVCAMHVQVCVCVCVYVSTVVCVCPCPHTVSLQQPPLSGSASQKISSPPQKAVPSSSGEGNTT